MLRKDGSIFYADIMGNSLTYDGRPCVLGLYRDISEDDRPKPPWNESEKPSSTCCNRAITNGN